MSQVVPAMSESQLSPDALPKHIAIIMDGNGRWAKARKLPRTAGHKKGADALRRALDYCKNAGVSYLTLYAFSSENWKRPESEINDLMQLLRHYLNTELPELHKNNIRLRFIGELGKLGADLHQRAQDAMRLTEHNNAFHLTVALSYGARDEMVRAVQQIAQQVQLGALSASDITEDIIGNALDTHNLPEPDLLIRTGGEQRLSNFLLWQSAYTELYFTDTLWPDFEQEHFNHALREYAKRERRYGTI